MLTLAIISYLLIGFLCAVVYEVRDYRPDVVMSLAWVALWSIFLPIMGLSRSIELCALGYFKFRDWRLKVAAKAVEAYKHKSHC